MSLTAPWLVLSVLIGTIVGAATGFQHGAFGLVGGSAGGFIIGVLTFAASSSRFAFPEIFPVRLLERWSTAWMVLFLISPISTAAITWWVVRYLAQ